MSIESWGQLKINEGQLFKDAVNSLRLEITDLNKEQLSKGQDAKGVRLPPYSLRHARARKKAHLQVANKDLKFNGDFWQGFYANAFEGGIVIGSSDWKEKTLEDDWGAIFGLNTENLDRFCEMFLPVFLNKLRSGLGINI
jgi:hypothetical protein